MCIPLKTPFIWLVWASNVKDYTLYVFGKNIALKRKAITYGKIVGRICLYGKFAGIFVCLIKKVVNLHIK